MALLLHTYEKSARLHCWYYSIPVIKHFLECATSIWRDGRFEILRAVLLEDSHTPRRFRRPPSSSLSAVHEESYSSWTAWPWRRRDYDSPNSGTTWPTTRGHIPEDKILKGHGEHVFQILGTQWVTWSKFHTEDPHTLGATAQNLVTTANCARDLCTPVLRMLFIGIRLLVQIRLFVLP